MRCAQFLVISLISTLLSITQSFSSGSEPRNSGANDLCKAIQSQVDLVSNHDPSVPVFIKSYEAGPKEKNLPAALSTAAFSYDNALAIIALIACNDARRARQIGAAFLNAIAFDRTFHDGRIRNAYRAGRLDGGPAVLAGWWDDEQKLWAEDEYQDGSQSGNVAWVALALLALDQVSEDENYREAAWRLADWISQRTAGDDTFGGFSGGVEGFDNAQKNLFWRSTEHNVDIYALGAWLYRLKPDSLSKTLMASSRKFLDAMFDRSHGIFRIGTSSNGELQPVEKFALDALIWPLVGVEGAPREWKTSLAFATDHLSVSGGVDFNGQRDGLWTEGTAQAALVERVVKNTRSADTFLATAIRQSSASGLLYATDGAKISTGLKVNDSSRDEDFFYYHRPHVGATAWAVLAAIGFNPFTGRRVN